MGVARGDRARSAGRRRAAAVGVITTPGGVGVTVDARRGRARGLRSARGAAARRHVDRGAVGQPVELADQRPQARDLLAGLEVELGDLRAVLGDDLHVGLAGVGHDGQVVRREDAGEPDAGERREHEGDRQDDGDVEEVDDAVERVAVAIGAVDAAPAHVAQPPAAARLAVERRARSAVASRWSCSWAAQVATPAQAGPSSCRRRARRRERRLRSAPARSAPAASSSRAVERTPRDDLGRLVGLVGASAPPRRRRRPPPPARTRPGPAPPRAARRRRRRSAPPARGQVGQVVGGVVDVGALAARRRRSADGRRRPRAARACTRGRRCPAGRSGRARC